MFSSADIPLRADSSRVVCAGRDGLTSAPGRVTCHRPGRSFLLGVINYNQGPEPPDSPPPQTGGLTPG